MRGIRVRSAPAGLRLEHVSPERHFAEDPANSAGLVAASRIRERVRGVTRRVEAAAALPPRNGVRPHGGGKRVLVQPALREDGPTGGPDEVVQDGAEPEAGRSLDHGPGPPPGDGTAAFAKRASGLHQRAFTIRVSAGWMTLSTSPYATASSGVMNRSRSMSFITCSSGWPEWREMISAIRRVISRISFAAI